MLNQYGPEPWVSSSACTPSAAVRRPALPLLGLDVDDEAIGAIAGTEFCQVASRTPR
jgi:hypothetical protein